MDDKEKIAMLESEKFRLQLKINQQEGFINRAILLLESSSKNTDEILKGWDETIKYLNTSYLLGMLSGISLLLALMGLIEIFIK